MWASARPQSSTHRGRDPPYLRTSVACTRGKEAGVSTAVCTERGARDFDFLLGRWEVRNRRLLERFAGSDEWEEFDATAAARTLPGVLGIEDLFCTDHDGGFVGMSFRFFDPETEQWSIYWADSRRPGRLDPPVVGSFTGDTGVFEGTDFFEGRAILVRFTWSGVTTAEPRWEQAFSADGGETWETNWVMDSTRVS